MMIAIVFGFFGVVFSKLAKSTNVNTTIFLRALITVNISYRIVQSVGIPTIGKRDFIKRISLRSIIGTVITYLFQKGLTYLSLKEFLTLFNTQPIFTFWLSFYFLGERYRNDKLICTILTILGVALVINPNYLNLDFTNDAIRDNTFYIGVVMVLIAAVLKAMVFIIIRTINTTSPFLNLLYFDWYRLILSACGYVIMGQSFGVDSSKQFVYLAISAILEYLYHIYNILAMKYETATIVSILETLQVLYGFLFDILLTDEKIYFGSVMGMLLVVCSCVYLAKIKETSE